MKLKKRGVNYIGLCPFHNEKSPSFTVSPSKEIYKCFGCGRSGNTIGFLMEHEKYSYVEALRWLAAKYNVDIEETETSPEFKEQVKTADSLYIINKFAQQFFTEVLFDTDEGNNAGLSYLKERGFREEIIKKFELGYNPEARDTFAKAATGAQFNETLLQKTGLVVARENGLQDNYRGRVIFPIHNQSGKIAGFGARLIRKNDKAPKYINTPENEIYVKSKILYGSYFARQSIDKADECLLVEGYTDVLALHQAGIENVVASGGTSLTPDQLRLIKKYTQNLTILYDGDAAGIKAALRGLDLALEEGLNVKLVLLPNQEDPDSYINKNGAASFISFIKENKKDFILFQLEYTLKDAGDDTNKRSQVVNQIAETISKINKAEDFTKQQDYIHKTAELLKIDEAGMHVLVNKFIREKITKDQRKYFDNSNVTQQQSDTEIQRNDWSDETYSLLFQNELQERAIVKVLVEHGMKKIYGNKNVIDCIIEEEFDYDLFQNKQVPLLIELYKQMYDKGISPTIKDFAYYEDKEISKLVIQATNYPYELSKKWTSAERSNKVNKRIWTLNYDDFMNEVIHNENSEDIIYYHDIDDNYQEEVENVLVYLKLQKIRRLILLNEEDFQKSKTEEEIITLQKTHLYLKKMQMELGKKKGMVIYPF